MTMSSSSIDENADGYILTRDHLLWFRDHYLGDLARSSDPMASPIFASSHADLPPALVITAEFDPLRDEGRAYADKLRASGVDVRLSHYDGMIHVFFQLSALLDGGRRAVDEACAALRDAFS